MLGYNAVSSFKEWFSFAFSYYLLLRKLLFLQNCKALPFKKKRNDDLPSNLTYS